jgi:glycosyltransferase involved in cell wall biosynthesis
MPRQAVDPAVRTRQHVKSARLVVSLVTPFFNEEEAVAAYFQAITSVAHSLPDIDFEFVCVNDGSEDSTLNRLISFQQSDPRVRVLDLSRNFGKEAALTAGIDHATGDAVIPFDADLQDPPDLIPEMVRRWLSGAEMVLARRVDRQADSNLKRLTANAFYRLHNRIADHPIPENVGDFRLMDRQVVDALKGLPERRRFMKGLFAWIGFRAETIDYTRPVRSAGDSKFSGWRLWNLALEGITSFSTIPLRVWSYAGFLVALAAFVYAMFIVGLVLWQGRDVPGYASLLTGVLFLGGLQLMGIGILGEYLGRVYMETKQRPIYVLRRAYGDRQHGT